MLSLLSSSLGGRKQVLVDEGLVLAKELEVGFGLGAVLGQLLDDVGGDFQQRGLEVGDLGVQLQVFLLGGLQPLHLVGGQLKGAQGLLFFGLEVVQ